MAIEVEGPDGVVLEFPDGTSQDTIRKAMQKRYGGPKQPSSKAQSRSLGPPRKKSLYQSAVEYADLVTPMGIARRTFEATKPHAANAASTIANAGSGRGPVSGAMPTRELQRGIGGIGDAALGVSEYLFSPVRGATEALIVDPYQRYIEGVGGDTERGLPRAVIETVRGAPDIVAMGLGAKAPAPRPTGTVTRSGPPRTPRPNPSPTQARPVQSIQRSANDALSPQQRIFATGKKAPKVASPVTRAVNRVTGGKILNADDQALAIIRSDLARDGATQAQINQILRDWRNTGASSPTLLDAIQKLPNGGQSTLARMRGLAVADQGVRNQVASYRKALEGGVLDRSRNLTEGLVDDLRTTEALVDDLTAQRRARAETNYRDEYSVPLEIRKETLAALSDAPGNSALLRSRASAVANQRWDQVDEIDQLLAAQGENFNWSGRNNADIAGSAENIAQSLTRTGTPVPLPEVPQVSGGTLDRARIQMREMARAAAREGSNDMARGLGERVGMIDATLDAAPNLRAARADYGNMSAAIDAAELGRRVDLETPSQFSANVGNLRSGLRPVGDINPNATFEEALALSSRNRLMDMIGRPAEGATGTLNRISGSPNMGENLNAVFGARADPYRQGIRNEIDRVQLARAIDPNTGSGTAVRGVDAMTGGLDDLITGVIDIKTGGFTTGVRMALRALREGSGLTPAEREAIARILLSPAQEVSPAQIQQVQSVVTNVVSRGSNVPRELISFLPPEWRPVVATMGAAQSAGKSISGPPMLNQAAAQEQEDRSGY